MKISKECLEALKLFEGFRAEAYLCPAGVWTLGYGHTARVKKGDRITRDEAERVLREDLVPFERSVQLLGLPLKPHQFDALVDFSFNLGTEALKNSTLLRKIKANPQDRSIRSEFKRWVYAGGKVLPGLVKRRDWEARSYFGELRNASGV